MINRESPIPLRRFKKKVNLRVIENHIYHFKQIPGVNMNTEAITPLHYFQLPSFSFCPRVETETESNRANYGFFKYIYIYVTLLIFSTPKLGSSTERFVVKLIANIQALGKIRMEFIPSTLSKQTAIYSH